MGTNYYFKKKAIDPARIDAIVDELNEEYRALVAKYNEKLQKALSDMGLNDEYEFYEDHTFYSPLERENYGDIHVGKISYGWKPLLQANNHFNSLQTLKDWYEQNKSEYEFIDEYNKPEQFYKFLEEIAKRNSDDTAKKHGYTAADGYDWEYRDFS